jgi:hypothetical protein
VRNERGHHFAEIASEDLELAGPQCERANSCKSADDVDRRRGGSLEREAGESSEKGERPGSSAMELESQIGPVRKGEALDGAGDAGKRVGGDDGEKGVVGGEGGDGDLSEAPADFDRNERRRDRRKETERRNRTRRDETLNFNVRGNDLCVRALTRSVESSRSISDRDTRRNIAGRCGGHLRNLTMQN